MRGDTGHQGRARLAVAIAWRPLLLAGFAPIAPAKPHKPKTATKRVSVRSNGSEVNADNDFGAISGNGRFVTFESVGKFTKGDSLATEDVFRHDRKTGKTRRASLKSNGKQVPWRRRQRLRRSRTMAASSPSTPQGPSSRGTTTARTTSTSRT